MTNDDEAKQRRLEKKRDARAEVLALTFAGALGGGFVFVALGAAVTYLSGNKEAFSKLFQGIGGTNMAALICGALVTAMLSRAR
jgi:purine-cytosine permease-like protein